MEDDEVNGRRGGCGALASRLFRERTYLKERQYVLSLFLSPSLSDMKNENYKGDNNKNSSKSGQAGAVHYSKLVWAAW